MGCLCIFSKCDLEFKVVLAVMVCGLQSTSSAMQAEYFRCTCLISDAFICRASRCLRPPWTEKTEVRMALREHKWWKHIHNFCTPFTNLTFFLPFPKQMTATFISSLLTHTNIQLNVLQKALTVRVIVVSALSLPTVIHQSHHLRALWLHA